MKNIIYVVGKPLNELKTDYFLALNAIHSQNVLICQKNVLQSLLLFMVICI